MSAAESEIIETEADAAEFLTDNPELVVVAEEDDGPVYFTNEDGEFTITVEWPDGSLETVPPLGGHHTLPGDVEVVERDDTPL